MPHSILRAAFAALLATALPSLLPAATTAVPRVEIVGEPGSWRLLRDGKPFFMHGVGGDGDYKKLSAIGGNIVRTYSSNNVEDQLRRAREAGIAVMFGLWIGHERHGFDYNDPVKIEAQRRMVIEAVTAHRDNPDILMWAVGNEMEGDGKNVVLWREINHLAKLIKQLDDRPVLTILAGAAVNKLEAVRDHCPDLDLLGINSYGGIGGVHDRMLKHGPKIPYAITEFGAIGHWEKGKNAWGVELEQTSTEKGEMLLNGWKKHIEGRDGWCLGGFAFRWGWKQEATHTWFALFLDDGSPTASIDYLQYAWTDRWPAERAPGIEPLNIPAFAKPLQAGQRVPVTVAASTATGKPLRYEWSVWGESRDRRDGGDREARPERHPEAVVQADPAAPAAELIAPAPGRYRLFITVRDHAGRVANHNLPFRVE
ncbi:MAG: hypothetical protein MUE42_04640 [Opitutaceae bacterium]|nr:hypothetical protein [Opitutaceae bacterium]